MNTRTEAILLLLLFLICYIIIHKGRVGLCFFGFYWIIIVIDIYTLCRLVRVLCTAERLGNGLECGGELILWNNNNTSGNQYQGKNDITQIS